MREWRASRSSVRVRALAWTLRKTEDKDGWGFDIDSVKGTPKKEVWLWLREPANCNPVVTVIAVAVIAIPSWDSRFLNAVCLRFNLNKYHQKHTHDYHSFSIKQKKQYAIPAFQVFKMGLYRKAKQRKQVWRVLRVFLWQRSEVWEERDLDKKRDKAYEWNKGDVLGQFGLTCLNTMSCSHPLRAPSASTQKPKPNPIS